VNTPSRQEKHMGAAKKVSKCVKFNIPLYTSYGSFRRQSSRQSLAVIRRTKIISKISQTNTKTKIQQYTTYIHTNIIIIREGPQFSTRRGILSQATEFSRIRRIFRFMQHFVQFSIDYFYFTI